MAETTSPTGVDQRLQDMAASWQPLIDSVNLRRQPAPATPERRGNLLGRIFGGHRGERQPAREPVPAAPPAAESSKWQPLARAVGKGLVTGFVRYVENINPLTIGKKYREGDWLWLLGGVTGFAAAEATQMGVGVAAAVKAGLPVGAGLVNIGINVAQGIIKARSEQGDQSRLQARLEEVSKKFPVASQRLRRFAAGFSAGTLYGSMFTVTGAAMVAADIGKSVTEEVMKSGSDILGTAGKIPEAVGSKIQEITGGEGVAAPAAPAPEIPAAPPVNQEAIAAAVGAHLDLSNQMVDKAIENMGLDPNQISQQAYEQARLAVQHDMEYMANIYFDHTAAGLIADPAKAFELSLSNPADIADMQEIALKGLKNSLLAEMTGSEPFRQAAAAAVGSHLDTVVNNTVNEVLAARGLDPTKVSPETLQKIHGALQHQLENFAGQQFGNAAEGVIGQGSLDPGVVADQGNKLLTDFLASQTAHEELVKTAAEALGPTPTQLPSFDLSSVTPSNVMEKIIPQGSTVGHMLFEAGAQTGWGADNADLFAATIAANYDLLKTDLLLSELKGLVIDAQNGNVEALKKLHAALRWIPAGAKLKILSKAGVAEVLAGLPG